MELQLPSFPIIFTFFLFVFMVVKVLLKRANTSSSASKLPPGPQKLPFVGNMHQLFGSLPHHALRDLAKEHGPFMYLRIGQVPTIVVSSPEYAKEVMRTHDVVFASRPRLLSSQIMLYDCTDLAFAPYGEYWRQVKKICMQELLSTARVQSFRSIREEEMFNLVEWIASNVGSPINLTEKIQTSTYGITSRAAFGKKSREHEEFISIVAEAVELSGGFELADLFPSFGFLALISRARPKLKRLQLRAARIMESIIKEHIEDSEKSAEKSGESGKEEDLVDVLLKFYNNGDLGFSLTSDNLKAVIWDIFAAGSETSATAVDWAMIEMIRNPRVMKKVQDEVREVFGRKGSVDEAGLTDMKYLKSVVKETLRLHPSAPLLLPRECGEKCEVDGYEIHAKTRIIVNAWAIGRDPNYWTEPESFIPERFLDSSIDFKGNNFEYIPFGAGRRICPGMSFGLINVELPLALLLYHFDWKLPGGMKHKDLDMTELFGVTVRRKDDLHLIPIAFDLSPLEKSK
ncbi:Cytochrome P450, E-class, group I [Parasponia andersonii]|uniref:Cytochrome P450, E-class, group I n=1 Tax=Parasponia andersonii TaxID=3476 RepID=A0A2P5B3T3_PARAD|nr:Cytochrome P450, E-class, group I [Parasponia andersonii]